MNSSVNETEKKRLPEDVAVKCISDHTGNEERVKFLREAAIMAQFNHPNIVSILGIVMESQVYLAS